jgi:16S rRNA (cytosine967-C5)-methyltransferase
MGTGLNPVINLNEKKYNTGTNPRRIGFLALNKYFRKEKSLSLKDILNHYLKNDKLSSLDRRFIFNIVKGTVRYYIKIDFIVSLFSDRDIGDIDSRVLNILRMGIFQLVYMNRIPDYSAVNESVELARKNVSISSSKFVNAVLRKICAIRDIDVFIEKKIEKITASVIDKISISYSYPRWLVEYWISWYGREKTVMICKSLNENPRNYLRVSKSKIADKDLLRELNVESADRRISGMVTRKSRKPVQDSIRVRDDIYKFLTKNIIKDTINVASVQDIAKTDAYNKGLVSIQDISSQIAVKLFLEPRRGEKILDVCAAPGGKTTYIAELVGDRGEVVSVDISKKRLEILKENLARLGTDNVRIIETDATRIDFMGRSKAILSDKNFNNKISGSYTGYFDGILLDAPCSALGTISKNPDVKYGKTMDDVIRLSRISHRMLVNCDRYLKPGGRLIFYTCTLSPIENQEVIDKFLKEFKGRYSTIKPAIFDVLASIAGSEKDSILFSEREKACLEIMPYYFKSEAGFVCSLIKKL